MKTSRYNRFVRVPDEDRYLMFNGLTTALISLDTELFEKTQGVISAAIEGRHIPDDAETQDIHKMLVDGRFIVPGSVDELALLKVRYQVSRCNDPLALTILPTLACNLACTYCYERPRKESMTKDTIEAVCAFVEERAKRERIKSFNVSWYGGEPLLAASTIWELSQRFLELGEKHSFRYNAGITTNGTLLTKEVVDNLLRYKVKRMQVTLDGPKEVHDARRPLKGGKESSFDAIMSGLANVIGKMNISVRINTDKKNAGASLDLLRLFDEKGWLGEDKKFHPYMASVSKLTEACAGVVPDCCTIDDFFDLSLDFCKACAGYGIPIKTNILYHFPVTVKYNCGAIALNTMVVNPSGAIHKCGLTVSEESESLGNVREPMDLVNPNLLKWMSFDPFDVEGCRECEFLPICLGACPKRTIEGEDPTQSNSCKYIKRNIDTILLLHGT